jgi:CheY-like chemotaxis protein
MLLLMPIVRAAVDSVSPTAESRNIPIQLRSSATSATVIGEAGRLQQVLSNVIFNAVKFSKDGDVVDVSVDQNGPFTRIMVCDYGQGISPEFLPYVFERFRQADGSTTRRYGGLGLGLAIARHILQLHDGTISVCSDGPGRGTRVTIELPVVARHDASGAIQTLSETSTKSRPAGPSRLLSGMQILAVDDHEETLDLLAALLEQEAAIVRRCRSAAEALNALDDFDADVLIADIAMPREDGCMLLQRMHERGKLMPAIAVTACVRREDRARILDAGFDLFLPKPIDPAILIRSLFQISRRHAASSDT